MGNLGKKASNIVVILLVISLMIAGGVGGYLFVRHRLGKTNTPPYAICFNEKEKVMYCNESWVVNEDNITLSTHVNDLEYTITAQNNNVLSVNNNQVTAISEGESWVKITTNKGVTATCNIVVKKEICGIELQTRTISRLISDNKSIDVYAIVSGKSETVKNTKVVWEIDGSVSPYNGKVLTIPAQSTEKNVHILASIANENDVFTDEITINWRGESDTKPSLKYKQGEITQTDGSNVVFALTSPYQASVYEWFVNDEKVECDKQEFSFAPNTAGTYEITAKVNGIVAVSDGNNVVMRKGSIIPSGIEIDYDTYYPQTLVKWNSTSNTERFRIRVDSGFFSSANEYEITGNSRLFSPSEIDVFSDSYDISVKSLGDRKALMESEYSEKVEVKKLSSDLKIFLEKTWHGGNYFITSDEEFYSIYDYFLLYREQPLNGNTVTKEDIYMGYESDYLLSRLVMISYNRTDYTGSYDLRHVLMSNNVATIEIEFETQSIPTEGSTQASASQLDSADLHLSKTGMSSNEKLSIENRQYSAKVSTSEQLYRVVELGYKPEIINNEELQSLYQYAKEILMKITDTTMTDIEKAHAIYDWVMWQVTYDYKAVQTTVIAENVKNRAYYLESVLNDYYRFSVCDGISKAYSLLCNMVGLPCYRVSGMAGEGAVSGLHAWNKVKVDGEWYIVDCTWGDSRMDLKYTEGFSQKMDIYEIGMHKYFLLTDLEISNTHTQRESAGFPSTSDLSYNIYEDINYNGTSAYLTSAEDVNVSAKKLASLAKETFGDSSVVNKIVGNTQTTTDVLSYELKYSDSNRSEILGLVRSTAKPYQTEFRKLGLNSSIKLDQASGRIIVFTSISKALS